MPEEERLEELYRRALRRAVEKAGAADAAAAVFRGRLEREQPQLVEAFDDVIAAWRASRRAWVDGMAEISNA